MGGAKVNMGHANRVPKLFLKATRMYVCWQQGCAVAITDLYANSYKKLVPVTLKFCLTRTTSPLKLRFASFIFKALFPEKGDKGMVPIKGSLKGSVTTFNEVDGKLTVPVVVGYKQELEFCPIFATQPLKFPASKPSFTQGAALILAPFPKGLKLNCRVEVIAGAAISAVRDERLPHRACRRVRGRPVEIEHGVEDT